MKVQLQNDPAAAIFSRQSLEFGNDIGPTNPETGKITFLSNFCIIVNIISRRGVSTNETNKTVKQVIEITLG